MAAHDNQTYKTYQLNQEAGVENSLSLVDEFTEGSKIYEMDSLSDSGLLLTTCKD